MDNGMTPGPWWTDGKYREEEYGIAIIAANTDCGPLPGNPTRGMVAWTSELLPENADRCRANALAISLVPEMVELLTAIRDERWNSMTQGCNAMARSQTAARALLAKLERLHDKGLLREVGE